MITKLPDFRSGVGPCRHPIKIGVMDGEVIYARCGSRLKSNCPSCSKLAQTDYRKLLYAGFNELGDKLTEYRFVFMTLTAPSFGRVHRVPKPGGNIRRCHCGRFHDPERDAYLRGMPVDQDDYDYAGVVEWNFNLGKLWNATRTKFRDNFGDIEYSKVAEWQRRGSLHLHVVMRLHESQWTDISKKAAGLGLTVEKFARKLVGEVVVSHRYKWGERAFDWRELPRNDHKQTIWYIAKALAYAAKDVAFDGVSGSERPMVRRHVALLDVAARKMSCGDDCQGQYCRRQCHRRWGARSSTMTRSRPTEKKMGWASLRRMDLKERRRKFAAKMAQVAEIMRKGGGEDVSDTDQYSTADVPGYIDGEYIYGQRQRKGTSDGLRDGGSLCRGYQRDLKFNAGQDSLRRGQKGQRVLPAQTFWP